MIATSRVESVNVCLKRLLHNLNISLCDFAAEIHKLLNLQDKEYEYKFDNYQFLLHVTKTKLTFIY